MDPETSFESTRWFTQEEFARFVERRTSDLERLELLNGRIVMNPPSGWPQGEASASVASALRSFVTPRKLGRVFGANQGFELPTGDTVGPDASFVSNERWRTGQPHAPDQFLRVVPDLIVEILSTSTASRDRGEKKAIYERSGVREYWLLDVRGRQLTRFVLEDERFGTPRVFDEQGAPLESVILPGLSIPLSELVPTQEH